MTGADPQREAMVRDREDAAAPPAVEGTPTGDAPAAEGTLAEGTSAAEGTRAEGAATDAAATGVRTPQPLSSLSSLVGVGFADGSTCTADGICD